MLGLASLLLISGTLIISQLANTGNLVSETNLFPSICALILVGNSLILLFTKSSDISTQEHHKVLYSTGIALLLGILLVSWSATGLIIGLALFIFLSGKTLLRQSTKEGITTLVGLLLFIVVIYNYLMGLKPPVSLLP